MKKLFKKDFGEEHNFWMSYTDLLSGFLIVFIIATIIYQQANNKFIDFNNKLNRLGYSIEEAEEMLREDVIKKSNMLDINSEFEDVFKHIDKKYYCFDKDECSIRLSPPNEERESIFFQKDSATMQPILKSLILKIGKPFVEKAIYLKKKYPNMEIRIEGHTDTDGSFMHNLELSSKRAYSVYECIHDDCLKSDPQKQKFVEERMISVGYSYAKPLDQNGKIIPFSSSDVVLGRSRRIEFRIISK